MHSMAMMLLIYYAWFIGRNVLSMGLCWFSKKPKDNVGALKLCFFCLDGIGLTIITIMCTKILASTESTYCSYYSRNIDHVWSWCLGMVILSYIIMVFAVCWCALCSCMLSLMCCILCLGGGRGDPRLAQLQNRVPMVNNTLDSLKNQKKNFGDLSKS